MVYQEKSHVIVMLTKVFDFIRVMCAQYWPLDCNKAKLYGQIEVTLLSEEPLADFFIRTFKIRKLTEQQIKGEQLNKLKPLVVEMNNDSNKDENDKSKEQIESKGDFVRPVTPSYNKLHSENDDFRIIYQFHYEKWPTHSSPFASSVLQFRFRLFFGQLF